MNKYCDFHINYMNSTIIIHSGFSSGEPSFWENLGSQMNLKLRNLIKVYPLEIKRERFPSVDLFIIDGNHYLIFRTRKILF